MTFTKTKQYNIKSNIVVTEYTHNKTGAKHIHTAIDGVENSFNIAFNTHVHDSRGIPHILEHIVLEGSKKYPVQNMFYRLSDKNFETMMNAGTYTDFTCYYFATNVESGFMNLADVYLDSVLNPLITEASFLQEGIRFEKKEGSNDLVFSGVVYNEMMAWVGKKDRQLHISAMRESMESHPLTADSGGDPLMIADVTYQDVLDFHKKYYHPSNATVFTTGSVPVEDIHKKIDEFFSQYEKAERFQLKEQVFKNDKYTIVKTSHAGEEMTSALMVINVGDESAEVNGDLLYTVNLVETKMRDYFVQNEVGMSLVNIGMYSQNGKNMLMAEFLVENEDSIKDLWTHWGYAVQSVIQEGIDDVIINNMFENEFTQFDAEMSTGYALRYNQSVFYKTMSGSKFYEVVANRGYIEQMQNRFMNENALIETLNTYFLKKDKATLVYSVLDENFIEKYQEQILQKEQAKTSSWTGEEKDAIASRLAMLRDNDAQEAKKNVEVKLPEVGLDSGFSAETLIPKLDFEYTQEVFNGANIKRNKYNDMDNRARLELRFNFKPKNEEEFMFEEIQSLLMEYTSFKGMNREETNVWKNDGVSSLQMSMPTFVKDNVSSVCNVIIVSGFKGKNSLLAEKALGFRTLQDFSKKEDTRRLISVLLNEIEEYQMSKLDKFASLIARANSVQYKSEYIKEVKINKKLKEMLSDETGAYERFVEYYESDARKNSGVFYAIADEAEEAVEVLKGTGVLKGSETIQLETLNGLLNVDFKPNQEIALVAETPSAFASTCVCNTPTVENIEEFMQMRIATNYMSEIATNTIRVEMGAYGAFATTYNGSVVFLSYRTPKPFESIDYYKNLVSSIIESDINADIFEGAKRNVVGDFLKYESKRSKARRHDLFVATNRDMLDIEKRKIDAVLNFKQEDMKVLLKKYFTNVDYHTCVATNTKMFAESGRSFEVINVPFEI